MKKLGPNTKRLMMDPDYKIAVNTYAFETVCSMTLLRCFQFEKARLEELDEIDASPYPVQVQQKLVNDDLAKEALNRLKSGDVLTQRAHQT